MQWARRLQESLHAAEGITSKGKSEQKGKGKGKGKKGYGASGHRVIPKHLHEMSKNDRWYLYKLWDGTLERWLKQSQAKCGKVEAKPFSGER